MIYNERRDVLVDSIRKELGSVLQLHGAEAGLHVTVTLPRESLWLWPLSPAYLGPASRNGIILGFGGTTVNEIPQAVRRLRGVLASELIRLSSESRDGMPRL